MKFSIVMPVYNEEAIVVSSVNKNLELLTQSGESFEIIIINDGSTDGTQELIENNFTHQSNMVIYNLEQNLGFGGAVRAGINISKGEYIWCIPADSPLTEEVFKAFTSHIGQAEVLVSYRKERLGYTWWMLLNSFVYHWLISIMFSMKLKDYNWIHLYHRSIFEKGRIKIEYNGIFMLAEILIKARNKGFSFIEFEVEQTQRLTGIATASKFINILKTFSNLITFKLKIWVTLN
jgi:dolichol-phosphate mannosyltransferase